MILRPCLTSASLIHLPRASTQQPWPRPRLHSRTFTTTPRPLADPKPTHYDILNVPPTVTAKDLKKQFYILSKENHPDLHPYSKSHTTKFQEISESYTVLADPEKRRKYDRDVMQTRPTVRSGSGFAGSRPATGLSKRRSTFRGPPPSFSGGRPSGSQSQQGSEEASGSSSYAYAWGPEPQFQQSSDFNPQPVYRTQTVEDQRREQRRAAATAAAQAEYDEDGDFWSKFVIVTVVIIVGTTVGGIVASTFDTKPRGGGMVRGDGSLRRPEGEKKKENG